MEQLIINVEYTKEVLRDLNRMHFKYEMRITRLIINIIAALTVICNLAILVLGAYDFYNSKVILCHFVIAIAFVISNTNIFADLSTKMFLKTDKLSLGLKQQMEFEEAKIIAKNEMETMLLSYDKIYKIMETREYIYIYLNKMQALIIDKNKTSNEELEKIKNILKDNVEKYIIFMK